MFCNQCGTQTIDDARFCSKCGTLLSATSASIQQKPENVTPASNVSTPAFGKPITHMYISFKGKSSFPKGYEWLEEENTLVAFQNDLVLIRGAEKRSAALDVIQYMGIVGGAIGLVRNIKDTLRNNKLELSIEIASRLFEDKLMVWCNKNDSVIRQFHQKPWMLIKASAGQLYCKFNSQLGVLHACVVVWSTNESGHHIKSRIDALGCKIVDVEHNIPLYKVPEAMEAARMKLSS
jgi:hypothetical protein